MVRPGGGVLNKGAAPRSTRLFGRQFFDPQDNIAEPPGATGFLRARLNYKYPRPWKTQDPEVWRHPDHLLPPIYQPQYPLHGMFFTHLCFTRDHVDKKQPEIIQANSHLARPNRVMHGSSAWSLHWYEPRLANVVSENNNSIIRVFESFS